MSTFKSINPKELSTAAFHSLLLSVVTPRPIGFVSTLSENGTPNLAPFSFFNAFGSNPPLLIFSPARRVRDNTLKHSLINAKNHQKVVINLVNYAMVEQMSLASCEYPEDVNEFIKAGFTMLPSTMIDVPRVGESPVSFECEVIQVIETGTEGGAGNLVLCKILMAHFHESIIDENNQIDHLNLDMVARLGADYYARITPESMFILPKPNTKLGVGFDNLPEWLFEMGLNKNELARIANLEKLPIVENQVLDNSVDTDELLQMAKEYLQANQVEKAYITLHQVYSNMKGY